MTSQILQVVIGILAPIVTALLTWAGLRIEQLIRAKVQQDEVRNILLRLNDAVFDAVGEVQQTFVVGLKAESQDGRLTGDDAISASRRAVTRARELLGQDGVARTIAILGIDEPDLEKLLASKIERAVVAIKGASILSPTR